MIQSLPGTQPRSETLDDALKAEVVRRGPEYRPRTRHLDDAGAPLFTNRLIQEASPYLLQHAHNPVDWRPWGAAAFEDARAREVPVLLSVGYSTCHWCHVMEHESFEDLEIAELMNRRYVCIKVDREELPDIDSIYMSAVQTLTGRGGWPMTVWLTAERAPYYGGTYFPPRGGMRGMATGFDTLLTQLSDIFTGQPEKIAQSSGELVEAISRQLEAPPSGEIGSRDALIKAWDRIAQGYDSEHGGFGGVPRFPMAPTLMLGLKVARLTGDAESLAQVTHTLGAIARGGIYDHLGGGFHRYSTDARWLAPHFEKMLYDQAMLVPVYLRAFQATGDALFRARVEETLDYVAREMRAPSGAFFAATDADSEGEEGTFFVWRPEEVQAHLTPRQAHAFMTYYDVQRGGNWEGKSILNTPRSLEEVQEILGYSMETLEALLEEGRAILLAKRAEREAPHLDDKVIMAWSGLMAEAFALGGRILGRPDYLSVAEEATRALLRISPRRRILGAKGVAYLDDLAALTGACIALFEATGIGAWLESALGLVEEIEAGYADPEGDGYYLTPQRGEAALVREKPYQDGVLPSANAQHGANLLRLYAWTDQDTLRARAESILRMGALLIEQAPLAVAAMSQVLGAYLAGPRQGVIITPDAEDAEPLAAVFRGGHFPDLPWMVVEEGALGALEQRVPALRGKGPREGRATAYVCEAGRCLAPTSSPEALRAQLDALFGA